MKFTNPHQVAQAGLVLQHLLLDISDGDTDKLQNFIDDPQSEERMKVMKLFTAKAKKISLLEYLSTRSLPAIKEFIARDRFIVDTSENAELKISGLGTNFKNWFLCKVEKNVGACEAKVSKLLKRSFDKPILDELGDKAENALAHVYEFLKTADRSVWHIFYVKDVSGVLRAVRARWYDDGWSVSALEVSDSNEWYDGDQVVSR